MIILKAILITICILVSFLILLSIYDYIIFKVRNYLLRRQVFKSFKHQIEDEINKDNNNGI